MNVNNRLLISLVVLEFQEECLHNQQLLLERVQQLEKVVLHSLQTNISSSVPGWTWPVQNELQLLAVEDWLKDSNHYQQEVQP